MRMHWGVHVHAFSQSCTEWMEYGLHSFYDTLSNTLFIYHSFVEIWGVTVVGSTLSLSSYFFQHHTTIFWHVRMMKGFRTLERGAERTQREMDIRSDLRRWDNDFPELHHELLVRWIAGAVVSVAVTSVYNALKPQPAARSRKY
eukprot:Nitzschia sp. Nitz4//scaffold30_size153850//65137//65568//NITZ4_002775-RA/size153850-exonerate_est2genome-gene-0.20-mRNA-2//-1//CDS//3329547253//3710//frame0